MEKETIFPKRTVQAVLRTYGFDGAFCEPKEYISFVDDDEKLVKLIFSVWLAEERRVVVKILHEEGDLLADREEIERQSAFSECMRQNGSTPGRNTRASSHADRRTPQFRPRLRRSQRISRTWQTGEHSVG